jgi:DNA recombination protein RmuC
VTVAIFVVLIVVLLLVVFLAVQVRGGGPGLLQQQLIELRGRLDTLVAAQRELPHAVTESGLEQARTMADLRERLGQLTEITRRLEHVGRSVADVQELLKVPSLRGALGELWLEELLRQVFPSSLYETQYAFRSGERVDAVLRVGTRLVPIDSKFPLEACHRMLASPEGGDRERRAFRRVLKQRIDEVAAKYIRPDEGTYDFALMYVPAENVYYEAVVRGEDLETGDSVVGYALDRKVIVVSPNTFYAYLVALVHGLRGLEVDRRAQEITDAMSGVQQTLQRFQRSFEVLGRHLENAGKQYGEARREAARVEESLAHIARIEAPGRSRDPSLIEERAR